MEDDPVDGLIALVADIDQMLMHVPHLMKTCYAMKVGALEAGFTEREASIMARDYYNKLIGK